jgi:hypothetical protein
VRKRRAATDGFGRKQTPASRPLLPEVFYSFFSRGTWWPTSPSLSAPALLLTHWDWEGQ